MEGNYNLSSYMGNFQLKMISSMHESLPKHTLDWCMPSISFLLKFNVKEESFILGLSETAYTFLCILTLYSG